MSELTSGTAATSRRHSTTFKVAVAMLAAVAVFTPTAVFAIHQFSDVPDSYAFHDEIDNIADAGVTTGFNDGTYRPSDTVRRGPMAAFMTRMGSRTAQVTDPNTASFTNFSAVEIDSNTIVVAGEGGNQLVSVNAWFRIDGNSTACPCDVGIRIVEFASDGTTIIKESPWMINQVASGAGGDIDETIQATYAFPVSSGSHTFTTQGIVWACTTCGNLAGDPLEIVESASVAINTPFGWAGSTGLDVAAAGVDSDSVVSDRPRG